jgi:hypothetical protein
MGGRGVITPLGPLGIGGIDQHVLLRGQPPGASPACAPRRSRRPLSCPGRGLPPGDGGPFLVAHCGPEGGRALLFSARVPPETLCPPPPGGGRGGGGPPSGKRLRERKVALLLGHFLGERAGVGMILREPVTLLGPAGVGTSGGLPPAQRTQRAFLASRGLRLPRRTGRPLGTPAALRGGVPPPVHPPAPLEGLRRLPDLPASGPAGAPPGGLVLRPALPLPGPSGGFGGGRLPVPVLLAQGLPRPGDPSGTGAPLASGPGGPPEGLDPLPASGHFPILREPEAFGRILEERLLPLAEAP